MRSIFRSPAFSRSRGDGEAKRPRADGMARLREVGLTRRRKRRGRAPKVHPIYGEGDSDGGAGSRENPLGSIEIRSARTANRHRWSGRGYQGAREIHGQGTRQIDPVTSGEGVLRPEQAEAQRIGPGNCLAKTQGCAKPQGAAYSLTPARCRKVKWSCQRKRSSEMKPR